MVGLVELGTTEESGKADVQRPELGELCPGRNKTKPAFPLYAIGYKYPKLARSERC